MTRGLAACRRQKNRILALATDLAPKATRDEGPVQQQTPATDQGRTIPRNQRAPSLGIVARQTSPAAIIFAVSRSSPLFQNLPMVLTKNPWLR
jgi:hypothetical protein